MGPTGGEQAGKISGDKQESDRGSPKVSEISFNAQRRTGLLILMTSFQAKGVLWRIAMRDGIGLEDSLRARNRVISREDRRSGCIDNPVHHRKMRGQLGSVQMKHRDVVQP